MTVSREAGGQGSGQGAPDVARPEVPPQQPQDPREGRTRPGIGLSGKLLLLTVVFVMLADALVLVPLVTSFRLSWLNDRLASAHTAALVLDAAPSGMVPESLARELLNSIGARAVAMKMGERRRLLAISDMPPMIDQDIDMRTTSKWGAVRGAFETLFVQDKTVMRVVGPAPRPNGEFIEVVLDEPPLRRAMVSYAETTLLISLTVAAIAGVLIYLALHWLFVRPMRRIAANLMTFRADPESRARVIAVSRRRDEIGMVERELAVMQDDIIAMLSQKSRLAALGLAVSKINHDLRNLLASVQLMSDQLVRVADPRVRRVMPKLTSALERAIALCQSTLSYGKAQEAPPQRRAVTIQPLLDEVRDNLGLSETGDLAWVAAVERGLTADADPDQLFRVVLNLARNAAEAVRGAERGESAQGQIRVTGRREGAVTLIEMSDTGPGVPDRVRPHLFEPFQAAGRAGGTGLGLAIAAELVRAHGGMLTLVEGTIGATFRIAIPDRPIDLMARREERASA